MEKVLGNNSSWWSFSWGLDVSFSRQRLKLEAHKFLIKFLCSSFPPPLPRPFSLNKSVLCFELVDNSGCHTKSMYRIVKMEKFVTYNSSKSDKSRNILLDSSFNWLLLNRLHWENNNIALNWAKCIGLRFAWVITWFIIEACLNKRLNKHEHIFQTNKSLLD